MAGYLEKHINLLEKRLVELERRANVNAFETQKKLDELMKFQEKAKLNFLDIEKKMISLEERPSVSSKVERIAEESSESHKSLEEKLEERMSSIGVLEKDHAEMKMISEREHRALEEKFEDRLKAIEDLLMLIEVEVIKSKEHGRGPATELLHPGIPKEWEDKLSVLEEKVRSIEKAKFKMPAERLNLDERLRSIEDNFLSLEARTREELNKIDSMVSGKALTEESTERFVQKIHERIEEIRRDVDRAQLLKNEIFQREKDFAKRTDFDNFQNFIVNEISKLKQVVDRVAALERSTDTRLIDIEERLSTELQKHSQVWKTDIASHRRDIDLAVIKAEEKILTALSEEMKRIEQVMSAQRAEVETLIKAERQKEREMEARATRIVTKELQEFASLLDKRFPNLASKNDFDRFAAEILSRVQKIEAPDTGPIMRRIEELEKRHEELGRLITQIAMRMPLVME